MAARIEAEEQSQDRVHYIDALKALVVYGIFFYHAALPFSMDGWLVHNNESVLALYVFVAFCFPWGIPLMFLIAGSASWFGLRSRGGWRFLKERFARLVLPLVAGILVLSPLQSYAISGRQLTWAGFLSAYVDFFARAQLGWSPTVVGRLGYHLWFLGYLFALSAVALPLMLWLRRPAGRRLIARIIDLGLRRDGLFLMAVPLAASQLALRWRFDKYQDWADVATYLFVLLAGFVLIADRRFETAVRRDIGQFIAVGIVAVCAVGILGILPSLAPETAGASALRKAAYAVLWSLNIWSWLMVVIYAGIRWLNVQRRIVTYGSESALPFYVLHHPVVVIVAVAVVRLDLGAGTKFLLLAATSLAITLCIYEFGVRRWNPIRFLFGLKPLPHAPRGARARLQPAA